MSKPQVTITLGRSGQIVDSGLNLLDIHKNKVVKNSWSASRADSQAISRRKRSLSDRIEKDADISMSSSSKRLQRMDYPRSSGSTIVKGVRVGQNDLRLKLVHKRTSRQVKHDVQEHTKTKIRQNTSTTILDPKGTEQTSMPSTLPKRIRRLSNSDVLGPSMPIGSMPMSRGVTTDADKPPTGLLSEEQSLTVSSLLNSLGLGKYAINFLSEEVDMTVLKQMQDQDLKALGLPMGPRKKILLAIMPRPKRQQQLQV